VGTLLILVSALVVSCGSWVLGLNKVSFGLYLDWIAKVSGILFLSWFMILVVSIVLALWVQKKKGRKIIWFDLPLFFALLGFRLLRTLLFIGLAVQWGSLIVGFIGILFAWISFCTGEFMFSFGTLILSPKKEKEPLLVQLLYTVWEVIILI
jgi:hypothetical protein